VRTAIVTSVLAFALAAFAQDLPAEKAPQPITQSPQVRINYLNVCTPSEAEQKGITSALEHIARSPKFAADFEIARGVSTDSDGATSRWVRLRREFPEGAFSTVQYSFVVDDQGVVETLIFRAREAKDIMQVSIDNRASATPELVLSSAAPAKRIRVEHLGKSSQALARCVDVDQKPYEAIFSAATSVLERYRAALDVRRTVLADLNRLSAPRPHTTQTSVVMKPTTR
jgi:hypothetical protein